MSKHKVKLHHWENGILKTFEHWFDDLEHAMDFASTSDAHTVKVLDANDNVISSKQSGVTPEEISIRSYA